MERFKSTAASAFSASDDDDDEDNGSHDDKLVFRSEGHKLAAEYRADQHRAYEEPWMINLGRGNDNAWLMGPRKDEEWFTGLAPRSCPGR